MDTINELIKIAKPLEDHLNSKEGKSNAIKLATLGDDSNSMHNLESNALGSSQKIAPMNVLKKIQYYEEAFS